MPETYLSPPLSGFRSTVNSLNHGNIMYSMYSIHGLFSNTFGGQIALLIFKFTSPYKMHLLPHIVVRSEYEFGSADVQIPMHKLNQQLRKCKKLSLFRPNNTSSSSMYIADDGSLVDILS